MSHIPHFLSQALVQIGLVRIKLACTPCSDNFGKGRRADVAPYGVTVQAYLFGNGYLGDTLLMQLEHLFIAALALRTPILLLACGFRKGRGPRDCCFTRLLSLAR